MNWFYNFKIKRKLIIAFIITGAISGMAAYTGIKNIKSINDGIDTLLFYTDKEKELLVKAEQALLDCKKIYKQIIDPALIESLKEKKEPAAMSIGIAQEKASALEDVSGKAIKLSEEKAGKVALKNSKSCRSSVIIMAALTFGNILIGLFFGSLISRIISAPFRKINKIEQSRSAAKEKGVLSQSGIELPEKSGSLVHAVIPQVKKTSGLVFEINTSSSGQTSDIEKTAKAIEQLGKIIQKNSAATEEMSSISIELAAQADQLRRAACFFKTAVQAFCTIRTAGQELNKNSTIKKTVQTKSAVGHSANIRFVKNAGVEIDLETEDENNFYRA